MTEPKAPLVLAEFLPYRLSVLANRVSRDLSKQYAQQFDLTITEWRILAILGPHPGVSADEVCRRSEMDKVAVSRAIRRLRDKGLINRRVNPADRRKYSLKLSPRGRAVYQRIVPLALDYEKQLLATLSTSTRRDLGDVLTALDRVTSKTE